MTEDNVYESEEKVDQQEEPLLQNVRLVIKDQAFDLDGTEENWLHFAKFCDGLKLSTHKLTYRAVANSDPYPSDVEFQDDLEVEDITQR